MADSDLRHRLLAILAGDAVGYSRLMSQDDRATIIAIEAARGVFRDEITARGGRVIDMAGDSVLAVFDAATAAVAAAVATQERLHAATRHEQQDRHLHFRIGVHLGDVLERADGAVYGDGVNIAARLQSLAEPGGILVSESIRMAAGGKIAGSFEDRGEQRLKNIGEPVRAFALLRERAPAPSADVSAALQADRRPPAPPTMLRLFGTPVLDHGGECQALPLERGSQLLVHLALKQTWVRRAELAAMVWPQQPSKLALTNLRKTLFRLVDSPATPALEQHGGALRSTAPTDVAAFELALRERRLDDALALRRGDLLEGFDDDANGAWTDWLGFERDRLRVAWRSAVLERISRDIDPARAVELSAQLLAADPLDEVAMQAHLAALARGGQAARARKKYREFSDRIAVELGLTPGYESRALHDRLALGGAAAPPPSGADAAPTTPARDDGFIGRAIELRRIGEMLGGDDCRLLTLIGPGGMGKTRLAQRAMAELAPRLAGGAAFVALDAVGDPAQLADQIARALDIPPSGTAEPFAALAAFLSQRESLLVLDNFEQLTAAASVIDALLGACPGLRILVTSRVRLALAAEHLLPLEGLPSPAVEDIDEAESFDAVRLFVQTARRVEPALVPAVEAAAIADICRLVEGLPLAIELAATWTRMLSCEAIAAELRQGSDLLSAADPTQPPRHASIDIVFEHSWSMLGAREREVLARLAIFRGGFTTESARIVAAASLPVLGALSDKSLLRKEGPRLSLHPLVQHLAGQRLADAAARTALETAHGLYFHRLLAQLRDLAARGDATALQRIEVEFENCRLAWRWAIRNGHAEILLESIATLVAFWDIRGRCQEGLDLLRQALDLLERGADPLVASGSSRSLQARLSVSHAQLEYRLDRYALAEASANRALALTRGGEKADDQSRLQCLQVLGTCALRHGRLEQARQHFEQALRHAPASRDPHNAATTLDHLALVHKGLGDHDEALRLSLESLAQHRSLGGDAGIALCLSNLASLQLDRGETASVEGYLQEALALAERHGLEQTRVLAVANLAYAALLRGELDRAWAQGTRAVELGRAAGYRGVVAEIEMGLSRCALLQGDPARAGARLVDGLKLANEIGRRSLQLLGLTCFADLLVARGDNALASKLFAHVVDQPELAKQERTRARSRLARLPGDGVEGVIAMPLAELTHRIVVEADVDQAPLIAALHATMRDTSTSTRTPR